jgi:O-antigen/teichoic acid export membrane protein
MASSAPDGRRDATVGPAAARNIALLVLQRGAQIGGGIVFAALVPRMMGPDTYGRYALVTSLAALIAISSSLGLTNTIGRYVPHFVHVGDVTQLQRIVGNLLTLRIASGAVAAAIYFLLTVLWLHDVDRVVLAVMAATVFAHGLTSYVFALLLGFDDAARWAVSETLRRWLSVALIVPAFVVGGLRGTSVALLTIELVLLSIGIAWSRVRVSRADLRLNMTLLLPYLRFGLLFFATQTLFVAFQASGEPLVRILAGDYEEVSYFTLANGIYLAVAGLFPQLMLAFVPRFTRLHTERAWAELTTLVSHLLTWLTVVGVVALFGALLLGEAAIRVVIGPVYVPAAANLTVLMSALLVLGVSSVTLMLGLVYERPGVALAASSLRLVVFWAVCPLCARWWGASLGASAAVLVASAAHAALTVWQFRELLGNALRSAGAAAALSLPFVPLVWLGISSLAYVAVYAIFLAVYMALLLRTGLVDRRDIAVVLRAVTARTRANDVPGRSPLWRTTI